MFKIKPLILLLLAILIVVAASLSFVSRYAKQAPQVTILPENQSTPTPPPALQAPGTPKSQTSGTSQQTKTISILSPIPSEKWAIGETNTIKWSKESGVPGSVYLVKASDKSIVGWINSEIGPHQTSFTWDGRDVAVSRYNAQKRSVDRGEYIIKIVFDTNRIPTISSGVFSLLYKSEIPIGNYTVTIKGLVFSPSALSVKKGAKLTFVNNDSVTHQVILSSFSPFVIESGGSYIFDTSSLFPGIYDFYSDVYSSLRLKVTVQ